MPLVFFAPAAEPRFLSTLKAILKSPEKGGLTANNLVFRYDVRLAQDGVGGEEGGKTFVTSQYPSSLSNQLSDSPF
jgi:hypothetical protein